MLKKNRLEWKYLLPLVHFLLSFFYERIVFIFQLDRDVVISDAINGGFSDSAERVMGYGIAKLLAAVMIFFLWHLIFCVITLWKERKNVRIFTIVTLTGIIGVLLMWPDPFIASEDNLITFSYALRFWPEYWHSAYTSCVYAGMMMIVPHPAFISVFQWIFAMFTLGYLYNRVVDSPVLKGKGKGLVFVVLLLPETYTLFTNAYRTELYALLCMFAVSVTAMDIVDKKKRGIGDTIGSVALCAFIGVWRTEGIILGILLFVIRLMFVYRYGIRKSILVFCCLIAAWVMVFVPQRLGDQKYYGKDYSFINSFPTLQNILNAPGANLSYEGVQEDLEAIAEITPIHIIRRYGMDGYRRYNYANGQKDINQSLADQATGSAYMKAYYRLVLHNIPIYARTQVTMLAQAIKLTPYGYVESSPNVQGYDLSPWELDAWDIGREDLLGCPGCERMANHPVHQWFYQTVKSLVDKVDSILTKVHFYSALLILIPLFEIYLFFREAFQLWKKKKGAFGLAAIAFVLLGQAAAIVLVMPAGVLAYLHAYYYCSLILELVYVLNLMGYRREKREAAD